MSHLPDGWSKKHGKLFLIVKCNDFKHAIALLNSVGEIAERLNHHPDLELRNYNELLVSSSTHSLGKITEKDYRLAQEITNLIEAN